MKQQGSVLIYILGAVAILALLGGSVVHSAMVEQRVAVNHGESIQDHFLVQAGINFGRKYIKDDPHNDLASIPMEGSRVIYNSPHFGGTSTTMADIGDLQVTLVRVTSGWEVIVRGQHQGATGLSVVAASPFSPVQRQILMQGVYLYGGLQLRGSARVNSNVLAHSVNIDGSARIIGNVQVPSPWPLSGVRFPTWGRPVDFISGPITQVAAQQPALMPTFPPLPSGLPVRGNLSVTGSSAHTITADGVYGSIEVSGSSILTINVGTTDRILRVRDLDVTGNARVFVNRVAGSTARLLLYVENSFDLDGSSRVNFLSDSASGDPNTVILYYDSASLLNFGGNVRWSGHMAIRRAGLDTGGSSNIFGYIVSGGTSVRLSGSVGPWPRIVYAPNAHIDIAGSSVLRARVVAKSMELAGSARVDYDDSALELFLPLARDLNILGAW